MPVTQQQWSPNTTIHCCNKQQIQVHLLYTSWIRNTCAYIWWAWKYFEKVTLPILTHIVQGFVTEEGFSHSLYLRGRCLCISLKIWVWNELGKLDFVHHKSGSDSLSITGKTRLVTTQSHLNALKYQDTILQLVASPYLHNLGRNPIIQDVNARAHRARVIKSRMWE